MSFGRAAVASIALLGAGCADHERAATIEAGVSGTVDDGARFSGVVGVVALEGELVARCTGTLVAQDLLLTARHCVAFDDGDLVTCGRAALGASVEPEGVLVTGLGEMSDDPGDYVAAAEIIPAPGGDDTCGFDLALVRLTGSPPGATAQHEPRLNLELSPDEPFTAVGYGSDGTSGIGTRRYRENARVACAAEGCAMPEVMPSEWLAEDGAFCRADSGAAAIDAEGRLIGSVSRGQNPCATPILAAMPPWQDWLKEVARSAAMAGGYPTPDWASETPPPPSGEDTDPAEPLKSSCSFAIDSGGASPFWLLLLAVAGRALRRART